MNADKNSLKYDTKQLQATRLQMCLKLHGVLFWCAQTNKTTFLSQLKNLELFVWPV